MENIIINIIICFIGLLGLFYGGEKLVTGSVSMASIFNNDRLTIVNSNKIPLPFIF